MIICVDRALLRVCVCVLLAPKGPDYMPCREMKSLWIDFLTQSAVFPCRHMWLFEQPACIIKDTYTHLPSSQLTACPLVFLTAFFLFIYFKSITSWGLCMTVWVYVCSSLHLCDLTVCLRVCTCV